MRRARSASLAELCLIVGLGSSRCLLFIATITYISNHEKQLDVPMSLVNGKHLVVVAMTLAVTLPILFFFRSVILLVRFYIRFGRVSQVTQLNWQRDDAAISPSIA